MTLTGDEVLILFLHQTQILRLAKLGTTKAVVGK
jgi:hypothetical protein